MLKPIVVVVFVGLALLGATALAGAARKTPPEHKLPSVVAVLGPRVSVPPGRFVRAYARCPRGYYVTGGGAYSGAITEIISSPIPNLRGWFVDGTNTSPANRTFQERADAVCVRGAPNVTLGTVAAARAVGHQAELDFATSRGTSTGR